MRLSALAKFGQIVGVVMNQWRCREVVSVVAAMRITRDDQVGEGFICDVC